MKIYHLQHKSIDKERWDNCIKSSVNQIIYAYSWYLDIVSPNWEALVDAEYTIVMPLPVKYRYKLPYIVQPILTQQLGIFSIQEIDDSIVQRFIRKIPYLSFELNLNENNQINNCQKLPNFLLNLNQPYGYIYKNYSKNTQRNIAKTHNENLQCSTNLTPEEFITFYEDNSKTYNRENNNIVKHLIFEGFAQNKIKIYAVHTSNKKLISALCLLKSEKRLIYLLPVSSEDGKKKSAMFLLVDELIKQEAGKKLIFDFEGSKIEGVARFYKGFGAKNHPYYNIKRFRPNFLIKK